MENLTEKLDSGFSDELFVFLLYKEAVIVIQVHVYLLIFPDGENNFVKLYKNAVLSQGNRVMPL